MEELPQLDSLNSEAHNCITSLMENRGDLIENASCGDYIVCIEDIYVTPEFRGKGHMTEFLNNLHILPDNMYPTGAYGDGLVVLEVANNSDNENWLDYEKLKDIYTKAGFTPVDSECRYMVKQLKKFR